MASLHKLFPNWYQWRTCSGLKVLPNGSSVCCQPLGAILKAEHEYLGLQPLAVGQELCCSFRNCRYTLHQPPANILTYAECEAPAKTETKRCSSMNRSRHKKQRSGHRRRMCAHSEDTVSNEMPYNYAIYKI